MVTRAYRTLFGGGFAAAEVPEALIGEMQTLLGLDDELDGLVLQGSPGTVEDWRKPLRRLRRRLSQGGIPSRRLDLLSD